MCSFKISVVSPDHIPTHVHAVDADNHLRFHFSFASPTARHLDTLSKKRISTKLIQDLLDDVVGNIGRHRQDWIKYHLGLGFGYNNKAVMIKPNSSHPDGYLVRISRYSHFGISHIPKNKREQYVKNQTRIVKEGFKNGKMVLLLSDGRTICLTPGLHIDDAFK